MQRLLAAAAVAFALFSTGRTAGAADGPLTVVELFTSQGCSSCPPADTLLGELAERHDVLALSMHVDYWDYIGWKDPFASAETTGRQRDYARQFGLRYVYTPQMIVHGSTEVTGSDRAEVLRHIARTHAAEQVEVGMRRDGDNAILVTVGEGQATGAAVWLVMVDRRHVTQVLRGENRGTEMRNYNVVRKLERIGTWNGEALTIPVTMPADANTGDLRAVFVQTGSTGPILGAARLDLTTR